MIIIKDGVRYRSWEPEHEINDFEPMIKYHVKDIFGSECDYFPKQKLISFANNRSIPDGFVIDFKNKKWYIIELKILGDDAIKRISGQIVDYKNAIRNQQTRREIYKSIKSIKNVDFLDDLINDEEPEIVIMINGLVGDLGNKFKEKVKGTDNKVKIIEFKTFCRDGVDPKKVHIHLFEPLYKINSQITLKSTKIPIEDYKEKDKANYDTFMIDDKELIPTGAVGKQVLMVIKKIKDGKKYTDAVSAVSKELDVRYQSVADKCGRKLTGTSKDFKQMVEDGTIYEYLLKKGVVRKLNKKY